MPRMGRRLQPSQVDFFLVLLIVSCHTKLPLFYYLLILFLFYYWTSNADINLNSMILSL